MVKALSTLVLFTLLVTVFSYPTPNEVIVDDMIFDKEFYDGLISGQNAWAEKAWPYTAIPVYIDPAYNLTYRNHIIEALMMIEAGGCITFPSYDQSLHPDYIHIRPHEVSPGAACTASVGYRPYYNYVNLPINPGSDCFDHPGSVAHEMLHSLAFRHMQNTPGRDTYLRMNWEYIASPSAFNIYNTSDLLGTPYDYDSVMHYSPWQGSTGKGPTFTPIQVVPPGVKIGAMTHLSQGDFQRLNNLYCGSLKV